MSQRQLHNKVVTARKPHNEMASEWFRDDIKGLLMGIGLTFSEWRAIAKLKANKWKILPGQKCVSWVGIDCDGDIYRAYYLPEIDAIVNKYELNYEGDYC
jgi:hypothetical protein